MLMSIGIKVFQSNQPGVRNGAGQTALVKIQGNAKLRNVVKHKYEAKFEVHNLEALYK